MNLNKVCYEKIQDSFYYIDYFGLKLVVDKTTGYFNATKLCELGGKRYIFWLRLDKTKDLIKILNEYLKRTQNHVGDLTYEKKIQNKETCDKSIIGIYIHEYLLLDLALWISTDFYLKCKTIITDYTVSKFRFENEQLKTENVDLKKMIENTKLQNDVVLNGIENIKGNTDGLNDKLDKILQKNNVYIRDSKIVRTKNIFWKLYNKFYMKLKRQYTI